MCWCAEDSGGSYSGRSSYDGDSRGGSSSDRFRGESADLVMQEDTIFVSGMPTNATEDDVKEHFGSIGVIKVSFTLSLMLHRCEKVDLISILHCMERGDSQLMSRHLC